MKNEKIQLNQDDWDCLFKSDSFTLGKQLIILHPKSITELAMVCQIIANIIDKIKSAIDEDLLQQMQQAMKGGDIQLIANIATAVLPSIIQAADVEIPQIMEILTSVDKNDIRHLPADVLISFALKVIEVNIQSLESLAKNLTPLIQKSVNLNQGLQGLNKKIQVTPKNV